jgi:hypothetical protein
MKEMQIKIASSFFILRLTSIFKGDNQQWEWRWGKRRALCHMLWGREGIGIYYGKTMFTKIKNTLL